MRAALLVQPTRSRPTPPACLALACWLGFVASAAADGTHRDGFDGPESSWKQGESDTRFQAEVQRVQQGARSGDACEFARVAASNGSHVHLEHAPPQARVIQELLVSLWLRSDRPGVQLYLRVVLPLTRDPETGAPATVLIEGDQYRQTGRWQQLKVPDPLLQVTRQVRVLQARYGREQVVDARLAYVDKVVVNAYGGQGVTQVWIDDLEIRNLVVRKADEETSAAGERVEDISGRPKVERVGPLLLVEDQPFFARMVRHRGEPLAWLGGLGFNVAYIPTVPSAELLAEAKAANLWLVCPPPLAPPRLGATERLEEPQPIPPQFDPVLAWHVGGPLNAADLPLVKALVGQLRLADRKVRRPILGSPLDDPRLFGRYLDLQTLDRRLLHTGLSAADYSDWLVGRQRAARPDTLFWATIHTQPAPVLVEQWRALGRTPPEALTASPGQIRLLVWTALAAGARGLYFDSDSALDARDPTTQLRAKTLELLNLELEPLGPWAASAADVTPMSTGDPNIALTTLNTNTRAKLMLVRSVEKRLPFVVGQGAANDLALIVPGLPESHDLFEFTPAGIRPLRRYRVAGGMRVSLPEFSLTSVLVSAPDALSLATLRPRIAAVQRRAAQLSFELAAAEMEHTLEVGNRLASFRPPPREMDRWLTAVRANLEAAERSRGQGDDGGAYVAAQRALRPLRMMQEDQFGRGVGNYVPLQSPYTVCPAVLPEHFALSERVRRGQARGNLLPAGDCESLDRLVGVGWTVQTRNLDGLQTRVEVVHGGAADGQGSLRLSALPSGLENAVVPADVSTAWVTSPDIAVVPGQLVRYRGRIRIPRPLRQTVDGLLIFDSHGGQELALRFRSTNGWEEFTFYRAAVGTHPALLTFVLTGVGEVFLDELSVEPIDLPK